MKNKEYKIENYVRKADLHTSALAGLTGLVSTVYALITQDQETAIAGGLLFTGGMIYHYANYLKAYCDAKLDYMNDCMNNRRNIEENGRKRR